MSADEITVAEVVRRRRRALSLTQAELAQQAGCRQSAISMFEAGRSAALARQTVERIAEILEIDLADVERDTGQEGAARELTLKYCRVEGCPSNIPYTVADSLCLKPAMVRAPRDEKTRCTMCGELMCMGCPNAECGVDVVEGSFCPECGTAYVPVAAVESGWQVTKWADEQREKIREIREMSRTVSRTRAS